MMRRCRCEGEVRMRFNDYLLAWVCRRCGGVTMTAMEYAERVIETVGGES